MPSAPIPPPPVAQVQRPHGYTDIKKIEARINNNMERMVNINMKKMMRMMTEKFSQSTSSAREQSTFLSQPEVNPKGHASSFSSRVNPGKM